MAKIPTYAVIMAGGRGTRFWPVSRRRRPKQFLNIHGRKTMLQETVARLARLVPPSRVLVVTGAEQAALVRRQLPRLPEANLLVEPVGRSTAPCIALAAEVLLARHADAAMAVLPADHVIPEGKRFLVTLRRALDLALRHDSLVTIGIRPSHAETGYGYIEVGRPLDGRTPRAHRARAFHEKPNLTRARAYYRSGRFLWNSGIFAWRASVVREQIARHLPATAASMRPVGQARNRAELGRALRRAYARVDGVSIDHGVLEKGAPVTVVAGDFAWSDVGSWDALPAVWGADAAGNAVRGDALTIDAHDNVVVGQKRLVALLGVRDCVIVDTEDALLVCARDRAQDVRKVIEELRRRKRRQLL
jgi:mannose-1-phosphate guanylyltransferase